MAKEETNKYELTDSVRYDGYYAVIDGETFYYPKGGMDIENGVVKKTYEPFFEVKSDKAYYELASAGVIKVSTKDTRYLSYIDKNHKQPKLYGE